MRLAASTQRLKSSRTRRRTSDLDLPLAWSIKLEPFSPLALSEADTVHRVRPDAREIKGDLPIPGKSGKGRSLDWQTEWIESVWPCLAAVLARCDDCGGYGARVVKADEVDTIRTITATMGPATCCKVSIYSQARQVTARLQALICHMSKKRSAFPSHLSITGDRTTYLQEQEP